MTAKTTKKAETTGNIKKPVDSYFDVLTDTSEKVAEGFSKARARNTRILDKFLETVEKGQKDMLELSRTIAAEPTAYKANLERAMETMTRRQECALDFGKTLYKEQSELGAAVSERAEILFAPFKNADYDWTAPYKSMTEFWSVSAK